jgi:hypothetical protein
MKTSYINKNNLSDVEKQQVCVWAGILPVGVVSNVVLGVVSTNSAGGSYL